MDLYELTMAQSYLVYKPDTLATFDLFVRALPRWRNYLIACGIDDAVSYLRALRFGREDIAYLAGTGLFSRAFLRYLRNFKFSGDVWAMPEGTICFAQEPLIRITAPIIQAQIVESFLLNTVNLSTMIASKASRVVSASKGRGVFDFSLRRTQGSDAAIKVSRAAYIAGFDATSNVLAGKLFGIPVVGTMAHSFVMSFGIERDAFFAYARTFPRHTILLVDTYDTKRGIENAIAIGLYLRKEGKRLAGIRLDSGDLVSLSRYAKGRLDKAGLGYVKIFASGNLDEFKIKSLLERGACVDGFGVGTNMGTSIDAPALDVIYKISEVSGQKGQFLPTMKLSQGKVTYPGRKQVFRVPGASGRFVKDILALEDEKTQGLPLLRQVMAKGRVVYKPFSLRRVQGFVRDSMAHFPPGLFSVLPKYRYPLVVSPGLAGLRERVARQLRLRQPDMRGCLREAV